MSRQRPAIFVFEPRVGSTNVGDAIIVEACVQEIMRLFPDAHLDSVSLHQPVARKQRRRMGEADLVVVAGSNMLNTRLASPVRLSRWQISLIDTLSVSDTVLMGVGWNKRSDQVNPLGAWILRRAVSSTTPHAVRDELTAHKLRDAGVSNAMVTSCPSLWGLSRGSEGVPIEKGEDVVTTLNQNSVEPEWDRDLLRMLKKEYRRVFFWPQGHLDAGYLDHLGSEGVEILPATLEAYDGLLECARSLDYVGLRVHGGVRALQKNRRAVVVSVDDRAFGLARSSGIPVVERGNLGETSEAIESSWHTQLHLPSGAISEWRARLQEAVGSDSRLAG